MNSAPATAAQQTPADAPAWGSYRQKKRLKVLLFFFWFAVKVALRLRLVGGFSKSISKKIWRWCYGDSLVDVVRYGIKWRLDFSNNWTDAKILLLAQPPDHAEINTLITHNDGWFVDVGANIGSYALHLAKAGAQVLALEPNPAVYERLRFNIAANESEAWAQHITPLPLGVGGEAGAATLVFPEENMEEGSMMVGEKAHYKSVQIQVLPLAEILQAQNIDKVSTLKIDIEGAEDRALIPFLESLPREKYPTCIVLEVVLRRFWQTDVVAFCLNLGYEQVQAKHNNNNVILHLKP